MQPMFIRRYLRSGFTLIELLVVIAIIALLMSILMPALAKVKRQAQGVVCQAILKQWATIFSMYTEDYDGQVPVGLGREQYGNAWTVQGYWIVSLRRYFPPASGSKIFFCPAAAKLREGSETGDKSIFAAWAESGKNQATDKGFAGYMPKEYLWSDGTIHGSIGYNRNIANWPPEWAQYDVWNIIGHQYSNVRVAGGNLIPVFGDNMMSGAAFSYEASPPDIEGAYGNVLWNNYEACAWMINRHGTRNEGVTNLSFLDGTVRKVGLKELWTLHWHKLWKEEINMSPSESEWPDWMERFKNYSRN